MDQLGHRAMTYAREYCPRRYAGLTDPYAYFLELGEQMRIQVDLQEKDLTPPAQPDEEWLSRAARLNTGRRLAEEAVFSQMMLEEWPAEPDLETATAGDERSWMNLNPPLSAEEGGPEADL